MIETIGALSNAHGLVEGLVREGVSPEYAFAALFQGMTEGEQRAAFDMLRLLVPARPPMRETLRMSAQISRLISAG